MSMTSDSIFELQNQLEIARNQLEDVRWERDVAEQALERMMPWIATDGLVAEHEERTMVCSFAHHMEKCSGPIMEEILRRGARDQADFVAGVTDKRPTVSSILRYMQSQGGGMSLLLLLWRITGEDPASAHHVREDGAEKFSVRDCERAWLLWGAARGLIS